MYAPDDLRKAIAESDLSVSDIAKIARIPRTTLYSFVSGETKSLRAVAQRAVQDAVGLRRPQTVQEQRAPFEHTLRSEAKALGLDPDAIAVKAVEDAIKRTRIDAWIEQNQAAMDANAKDVRENGLWSDGLRLL